MGFLHGSVTGGRFAVAGGKMAASGADLSDLIGGLEAKSFRSPLKLVEGADYPQAGWCGGLDEADVDFDAAKVVRGPFLVFAMLVTKEQVPRSEVAARAREELAAMALGRPPRPKDRREAARAAEEALRREGRESGKYLKKKVYPVVYDSERRHLWVGAGSHTVIDAVVRLVADTFGDVVTPMDVAARVDDEPAGVTPDWLGEDEGPNAWGNLFARDVVMTAADKTIPKDKSFVWPAVGGISVTFIPRRTLTVRCPLGVKGTDRFDHELPYSVPELADAFRDGKLPTVIGLDILTPDEREPVPLTLCPHRMTVSGMRLSKGDVKDKAQAELARLERIRGLFDSLDGAVLSYVRQHTA